MPVYSNLYANLARQGITKTFTHGYAQSVVAATHPQVYASNNRPGFSLQRRPSKLTPFSGYHFHNAFHTSAGSNSLALAAHSERADHGLDAYFDAWKRAHVAGEPDKEWVQFQFAKRIEWKPDGPALVVEDPAKSYDGRGTPDSTIALKVARPLERAYSASAVEDIKKVELSSVEEDALAQIDAALEKEIQARAERQLGEGGEPGLKLISEASTTEVASSLTLRSSVTRVSTLATPTSTIPEQSQSYADHLVKLAEAGRYSEIPVVFEAMLVGGIAPTPRAYNALLDAATHITTESIQVVPKALDIYSDMLKRRVVPDTVTYDKLLNVLCSRTLEVAHQQQGLEKIRKRYANPQRPGEFMFASHQLEQEILAEDDRLDLTLRLYKTFSDSQHVGALSTHTYNALIQACATRGRSIDMARIFKDMEQRTVSTSTDTYTTMMKGYIREDDLVQAIDCYEQYKALAIRADNGDPVRLDREDVAVYAAVIRAYVLVGKHKGALQFFNKLRQAALLSDPNKLHNTVLQGFIIPLLEKRMFSAALQWSEEMEPSRRVSTLRQIAVEAADGNDPAVAEQAINALSMPLLDLQTHHAMLAMHLRAGNVVAARQVWSWIISSPGPFDAASVEPVTMLAVALIQQGHVVDGLQCAEEMFSRLRTSTDSSALLQDQIEEGSQYIARYMSDNNVVDPRMIKSASTEQSTRNTYAPLDTLDTFDPYAHSTDFKGSAWMSNELERAGHGDGASRLSDAMHRLKNMRRAGRHPRYVTYAKLISAAAREQRINLVHDILGMARHDVPLIVNSAVVRYGWVSILDAMVAACLSLGKRELASQYHQELNDIGASPSANTFGLYITTLKDSAKSFDEASEAMRIFHRAKAEGIEPTSFLYNALIGKLGKARRIDDCLLYFTEMRNHGIRPTSVTYGTIVNALCRVSDERFAEELFDEMESMPNYKPRPAPYNSMMQFFLTTKRDKAKVLAYYERMRSNGIEPTKHTFKLLVDTHATLEPINMEAAEAVLDVIRKTGETPEAVHYASLIHAKGCVLHDMAGARLIYDAVLADRTLRVEACIFQALLEALVANHRVEETGSVLAQMAARHVSITPYIANTLIHGWAQEGQVQKCREIFQALPPQSREPSTYESMTRALLSVEAHSEARTVIDEMLSRGYPNAVAGKILDLLGSTA